MRKTNSNTTETGSHHDDAAELQFFERQLQRYNGDGDCAYERSLNLETAVDRFAAQASSWRI